MLLRLMDEISLIFQRYVSCFNFTFTRCKTKQSSEFFKFLMEEQIKFEFLLICLLQIFIGNC